MITFIASPSEWAQEEFSFAQLGDKRRTRRLVSIAERLAMNPDGTMPQAMTDWAELKGAYRFFNQSGVNFESICTPHWERTWKACREPGEFLIIEDTTELDYTRHNATRGLGPIGDGGGKGLSLHSALALQVDHWTLDQRPEGPMVGLFGQQCTCPRRAPENESRKERLSRPRKSQKWASVFKMTGAPPPNSHWTFIADRESDCYETLDLCQKYRVDFVVRACQDRRLVGEEVRLREAIGQAPVLGTMAVELRARGPQPARTAVVELRSASITIDGPWRPGGCQPPLKPVNIVEVREINPPEGIKEPLHWILLTTLPCQRLSEVQRVVGRYATRWIIEEYHKALKSGAGVENSQLEEAYRLEALIAVLAIVAVRLLNAKILARSQPDHCQAAQTVDPKALEVLEKKLGQPHGGWTNRNLIRALARLGGFIGRKNDGEPGWQTIWRGWHRLMWICEGLDILNETQKRCG